MSKRMVTVVSRNVRFVRRNLVCTEDQLVWTSEGWKNAKDLQPGDLVIHESHAPANDALGEPIGNNSPVEAEVMKVEPWIAKDPFVYDLDVEGTHSFYANGIAVHNCQDSSNIQKWMGLKAGERQMWTGDEKQAIYAWRGADSDSISNIRKSLQETNKGLLEFPLTVTRRCPKSHVALAQKIAPYIQAMPDAPDGKITIGAPDARGAKPGDLIVSRINAPLIETAYQLISQGIPATIKGRDLSEGLLKLLDKAAKRSDAPGLRETLMEAKEITEADMDRFLCMPNGKGHGRAAAAEDKMICLATAAKGCRTVSDLRAKIANMFSEKKNAVNLGTIYSTKGLEAPRVWVLRPDLIPHPLADKPSAYQQELHCLYIAVTRAKYDPQGVKGEGELVFCGPVPSVLGGNG